MKKIVCAALASAALLLLAVPVAQAADAYGSLSLGLTDTMKSDASVAGFSGNITLRNAPNFSGALGLKVTPNFRSELELSYRQPNLKNVTVDGVGSASLGGHLGTWGLLLNGYYDFLPGNIVSPYLSAGVGVARHNGTIDAIGGFGFAAQSASDTVFAYQAGAGLDFSVADKTTLFLGYRYFATAEPDFDGLKASYATNEIRAGIRQSF